MAELSEAGRCPACGEPLYGWVVVPPNSASGRERLLDRCEACGLGIAHEARSALPAVGGGGGVAAPNRRSWQAGIGGAHWAALGLDRLDCYPTPRALALLFERSRLEPMSVRQPALGRNQVWMWQTMLNAFTFHDGFAVRVLRGELTPRGGRGIAAFVVDSVVSLVAALPVALISVPLELAAVAVRRGGLIEAEVRQLRE